MYLSYAHIGAAIQAQRERVDAGAGYIASHRIQAIVDDITATLHVLLPIHEEWERIEREHHRVTAENASAWILANHERQWALGSQVAGLFKALYFFGTALQDAICDAVHYLGGFQRRPDGNELASMAGILGKAGHPITRNIRSMVPAYVKWFERMQHTRNLMKAGIVRSGARFKQINEHEPPPERAASVALSCFEGLEMRNEYVAVADIAEMMSESAQLMTAMGRIYLRKDPELAELFEPAEQPSAACG